MTDQTLHFGEALLGDGWASGVRVAVRAGVVAAVERGVPAAPGDERHAVGLPGMPNLHSHAFQRGMAGLAEVRGPADDSFWTWRRLMYRFVDAIEPEDLTAIAALAYAEMLESGFTRVGEFHYLHHGRDGAAYADRAEMSRAIVAAAEETGIALTHLPVLYAQSGFGEGRVRDEQRRFANDPAGYARLLEAVRAAVADLPDAVVGLAPHSLRAVAPEALAEVLALDPAAPVHIHVAEQVLEVEECLAWSGKRPVQWLIDRVGIDLRWCLVHATHVDATELAGIAASGAVAGLCPITEANLGDGIFPAVRFAALDGRYGVGSDSNVLISAAEELRLLEYGQRLVGRGRNRMAPAPGASTGEALYRAALAGGSAALGLPASGIAPGLPADLVSLDAEHPALVATAGGRMLDGWIFALRGGAVDCVWRRGVKQVEHGRHRDRARIERRYRATMRRLIELF